MTRKWLRALLIGMVLLALLLAGGVALLLQGIDRGAVMARAVQEVKAATGRDFAVDGRVRLRFFPRIALVAEGVRLGNAPWGSRPDMVRIAQLQLDVALRPLLSRQVEIARVEVSGADVLLETSAEGQGNWNLARPGAAPDAERPAGAAVQVTLVELLAKDSVLAFRSGRSGHTEHIDIEALSIDDGDGATPPDSNRVALDAVFRAQKVRIEGSVGLLRRALASGQSLPFDLALRLDGANATVRGDVELGAAAGQARMRVEAQVQQGAALDAVVGVRLPLPVPATLRGDLNWRARELVVDPFELQVHGQAIGGRIVWDRAASPPAVRATLHADGLDLPRLFPAAARPSEPAASRRLFSETPFPAWRLPGTRIAADLRVERLVLPNGLELTSVQAAGNSQPDRFELSKLGFDLARGRFELSGSWRPDGAEPPRVALQATARGVAMDALLALLRREAVLSGGRTEMDASLGGSGRSPHALAASLNGDVRLRMGEASSVGFKPSAADDLLATLLHALTPLRQSGESLKIQCATARLPIRAGRIVIDRSIAMEGDRLNVVMSGLVDLGEEHIELAMRPTVKKGTGLDPTAFAGVVKIAGPLAAPHVEVSLAGTAREAITVGAAVATSGATLLGERLLGKVTDPHPCEAAWRGSAATSAAPGAGGGLGKSIAAPFKRLFER